MSKLKTLIDRLDELRDKATPTPYEFYPASESDDWTINNDQFTFVKQDDSGVPVSKEDGQFIVESANNIKKLTKAIRIQTQWLNYIANSGPGHEQKFELENKRAAVAALDEVEKLFEGDECP